MKPPIYEPQAREWRELLETVEHEVTSSRRPPSELREGITRALAHIDRLERAALGQPDALARYDLVAATLEAAATEARRAERTRLGDTLARLADAVRTARLAALERLAALPPQRGRARAVDSPPFEASRGVPRLQVVAAVEAAPLSLRGGALDLEQAWAALEGGAVQERAELGRVEATTPSLGLRAIARDCLEDVGALGLLRRAHGEAMWQPGLGRFEERLLACFDALAATGQPDAGEHLDVRGEIERYAQGRLTVDPMRAFAHVFTLGCLDGPEMVRAAVAAARRAVPGERGAVADALALAVHPGIGPALQRLALDAEPSLASLALDVLRRRREVDFGSALVLLAHPDGDVRVAAARALATTATRDASVAALEDALASEADALVALALAKSLVLLDAPSGLDFARRALARRAGTSIDAELRELLGLVALAGSAADAELIDASRQRHQAWAAAVGWHGSPMLGDRLAELLADDRDDEFARAADQAFERLLGEPRPSHGWARAWRDRRAGFDAAVRLRFGAPFAIVGCLDELERPRRGADRERTAFELLLLSAGRVTVDPHGWVARQRAELVAARALLALPEARALHRPGEWPADRLGRRWMGR